MPYRVFNSQPAICNIALMGRGCTENADTQYTVRFVSWHSCSSCFQQAHPNVC